LIDFSFLMLEYSHPEILKLFAQRRIRIYCQMYLLDPQMILHGSTELLANLLPHPEFLNHRKGLLYWQITEIVLKMLSLTLTKT
jgi:hypothetical protein